jgi:hypothetical protein
MIKTAVQDNAIGIHVAQNLPLITSDIEIGALRSNANLRPSWAMVIREVPIGKMPMKSASIIIMNPKKIGWKVSRAVPL